MNAAKLQVGNERADPLNSMRRAIDLFRELDHQPSALLIQAFLFVASRPEHDDTTPADVATALNIKSASVAHILARLKAGSSPKNGEALGLLSAKPHPTDGRKERLYLTAHGKNLARNMAMILGR